MQQKIKAFTDQIFSINSSASTTYGSALNVGNKTLGEGSSASDLIYKLRTETALFSNLLHQGGSESDIEKIAMSIEGSIRTLQIIGQISDQFCSSLISELQEIAGT